MKLFSKLLQVGGLVFFCILVVFVILFTEGYQYDAESKDVIKKNVVFFEDLPKDAKVILDGKEVEFSVPGELRVVPTVHEIEITRNGFYPWKKRVEVSENFIVKFPPLEFLPTENTVLFKSVESMASWSLQNLSQQGVLLINDKLHFGKMYSANDDQFRILEIPLKFKTKKIISFNNKLIGITNDSRLFVYDLEQGKLISNIKDKFKDLKEYADDIFAINEAGKIVKFSNDFSTAEVFARLTEPVKAFGRLQHNGKYLAFSLVNEKNKNIFIVTDPKDGSIVFQEGELSNAFLDNLDKNRIFFTKGNDLTAYDLKEKEDIFKKVLNTKTLWLSRLGSSFQFLFVDDKFNVNFCDEDGENCHQIAKLSASKNGQISIESSQDGKEIFAIIAGQLSKLDLEDSSFLPTFLQDLVSLKTLEF
ncbi:MAG: hypothetical protein WCT53_00970 [Candidatus Gracilibacteria bacterium]